MVHVIANPNAQSGRGAAALSVVERAFSAKGIPCEVHLSEHAGHITHLAHEISLMGSKADPVKMVVLGGDGSLNEAVNGIADFEAVHFAILPVGSGNDFFRGLRLKPDLEALLPSVLDGAVRRTVDLGKVAYASFENPMGFLPEGTQCADRLFGVSCGIGFDAGVCVGVNTTGTKGVLNALHLGSLSYGVIALKQILRTKKVACDIESADGTKVHLDRFLFTALHNSGYEGGGYEFAPDGDMADGLLNLITIGNIPTLQAMLSFPAAHSGKAYDIRGVQHFLTPSVRIRTEVPLWVHTDGEVFVQSDDITVSIVPKALQLMI